MTRGVQASGDGVRRRHHVWNGEEQGSDAGDDGAKADPAGDVTPTSEVAHDDRWQDAADLDRGGDQTWERAANLKPLLNGRDDTVHVARRQRTCQQPQS